MFTSLPAVDGHEINVSEQVESFVNIAGSRGSHSTWKNLEMNIFSSRRNTEFLNL